MINKDKLIKLIQEAEDEYLVYEMAEQALANGVFKSREEYIADYLIANGVILPPCKVGDKVYLIKDNFIEPCEVEGIYFTRRKKYVRVRPFHQEYIGNWSVYYTPSIRSFGKTVFLTSEEAKNELERSNNNG